MGRFHFRQQQSSYSTHKESRQQQSYSMHRETNNYSKNSIDDLRNHLLRFMDDLHSESQALRHHSNKLQGFGAGRAAEEISTAPMPFAAASGFGDSARAHFSNFGSSAPVLNTGMGNAGLGSCLEEVVVVGPARTVRMQEMVYQRSSWGGGGFDDGGNWNGYSRVEWSSKGNCLN